MSNGVCTLYSIKWCETNLLGVRAYKCNRCYCELVHVVKEALVIGICLSTTGSCGRKETSLRIKLNVSESNVWKDASIYANWLTPFTRWWKIIFIRREQTVQSMWWNLRRVITMTGVRSAKEHELRTCLRRRWSLINYDLVKLLNAFRRDFLSEFVQLFRENNLALWLELFMSKLSVEFLELHHVSEDFFHRIHVWLTVHLNKF